MNILVLTSVYPPLGYSGHDERCRQTVNGLARRGHRFQVLTSDHRLPPVGGLKEKGIYRQLCLYEDSYQEDQLGVAYAVTHAHESYNGQCLEARVRSFKPDVVLIWNMRGLSKSLLFRLQNRGIPLVFDLHADWIAPEYFENDPWFRWWFNNPSFKSAAYQKFLRWFGLRRGQAGLLPIQHADGLDLSHSYLCSESLRETLLSGGIEGVRGLPVIYPFADESLLSHKVNYRKRMHFMWAGRVSQSKAPDLAIEAVRLLRERGIEVRLDIFGLGEQAERKALREEIQKMGLGDLIQMKGIRPGELRVHFANYDALLFTSRNDDPFPMTVLEAMLSRLPCILSRTGGIPEMVGDSGHVVLFERDDVNALVSAIQHFWSIERDWPQMAEGCIQSLRAVGSFDHIVRHMESLPA